MWKDEEDKVYSEEDLFDIALEECHSKESAYNHIDNLIEEKNLEEIKMKTIQEMIKDLTGINVEQNKIDDYLEEEYLDLSDTKLISSNLRNADLYRADLRYADLKFVRITKQQLQQLIIIEEDE